MVLFFWGGARFPPSWDLCDDSQKFTAAPVCPLPRESCIIAAAKSGLLGALLCGGIDRFEGKVVGHHL
jgi:hypothetical protein